ncbi:Hypothetical predicted protein [Pelobates cultripes]|uniref:P2X purinoreceptor 7 intracellular domain-containing protein n=1 Tax=Pelobates cultripes TaxID=61616 RepID=A0AAD1R471_PELCU|nr:Hypothetical predicted protein [Pelobates cultripes]
MDLESASEPGTSQDLNAVERKQQLLQRLLLQNASKEPCFQETPLRQSAPEVPTSTDEEGRIGNTDWCTCGNCITMPTAEESICCKEIDNVVCQLEDAPCIIHHTFFKQFCQEDLAHFLYCFLGVESQRPSEALFNRQMRKTAYRGFTTWIHGYLGRKNRRPIPSCAVHAIRTHFPDPENSYVGFIRLQDYNAIDMADDF